MAETSNEQTENKEPEQTEEKNKPEKTNEFDTTKLDGILDKRVTGLLKSILKENGISDENELKEAVNAYKIQKANKQNETATKYANIEAENAKLKAQILSGKLSSSAIKAAEKLNVNTKYIPTLLKLIDLKEVEKDGDIDENKLSDALGKVENIELFKNKTGKEGANGFTNIGGKETDDTEESAEQKIRKAMGLKS